MFVMHMINSAVWPQGPHLQRLGHVLALSFPVVAFSATAHVPNELVKMNHLYVRNKMTRPTPPVFSLLRQEHHLFANQTPSGS